MRNNRNAEGYFDPTAGIAISRVTRQERKAQKKQYRRWCIFAAPMQVIWCGTFSRRRITAGLL